MKPSAALVAAEALVAVLNRQLGHARRELHEPVPSPAVLVRRRARLERLEREYYEAKGRLHRLEAHERRGQPDWEAD